MQQGSAVRSMQSRPAPARRARSLLVAAVVCAALAGQAVSAQRAAATNVAYCVYSLVYAYDHCDANERHSLSANAAAYYWGNGGFRVCAGATLNGSFYGSYACGTDYAAQCYDGSNLLVGRIHNGEAFAITMKGRYYYSELGPCV
jgi:hypothetical protein